MLRFNTLLFAFLTGVSLTSSCDRTDRTPNLVKFSGFTMGTIFNIQLNSLPENIDIKKLESEIHDILFQVNNQMSTYQDNSELSKINFSKSTDWINISNDLYTVISTALLISNKSGGAFDITIGPVVNLWGFGPGEHKQKIPSVEELAETLSSTGDWNLHLRQYPYALRKDKADIYIDLSGIAKGYAVDKIAARLDQAKIKNYMVEIGGEIKAKGLNDQNMPWQIGIEKPVVNERKVQDVVKLDNLAMATSGDYRNFFDVNGKRYSHTIDPKTGWPVAHRLTSVTVFHESAMYADAMATALLVLGPETGMQLANQEGLATLFIIREENKFIENKSKAFELLELEIK